jgi:RNA polymerase sigma factor (sigma-70 family)
MPKPEPGTILSYLRTLLEANGLGDVSDGRLLEQFVTHQEELAFNALMRRHGPMVFSVCRRVLHENHDAEDAFQATFLLLARKAGVIRKQQAVGGWLHGVARRLALKARTMAARRDSHEKHVASMKRPNLEPAWTELNQDLDSALQELPAKYREPIVLCYLEGKTQEQSAKLLGCSVGTVRNRLAQGRNLLRDRLTRRGCTLSAAAFTTVLATTAAARAVPIQLRHATLKAAVAFASGSALTPGLVSSQVVTLVNAGIKAMVAAKIKLAGVVIVSASLLGLGAAAVGHQFGASSDLSEPVDSGLRVKQINGFQAKAPAKLKPAKADNQETMAVKGQVVDVAGQPVAGADVALLGWASERLKNSREWTAPSLAKTKADSGGRFVLQIPAVAEGLSREVFVVAGAAGHALACKRLDPDARQAEVELRLPAEQIVRGRLVDLQGQAAAGVKVRISNILQKDDELPGLNYVASALRHHSFPYTVDTRRAAIDIGCWPKPVSTNEQGEFAFHGLAADWSVEMDVESDKFAPQEFVIPPKDRHNGAVVTKALASARLLEGRVMHADTGKLVPNADLDVWTQPSPYQLNPSYSAKSQTDGQGRFRISLPIGQSVTVMAYAPAGTPYLAVKKELEWTRSGEVKQEVNLALPRGILVRGSVTEVAPAMAVAGAHVAWHPLSDKNPYYRRDVFSFWSSGLPPYRLSGPDGKFEIAILPGPGHLVINGPTLDYLHTQITTKELDGSDVMPNRRHYFDGLLSLNLKPQAEPYEVIATLRRGVTLSGRLMNLEGTPVQSAVMFCRSYMPYSNDWNQTHSKEVKGGRFELPGCDPEGTAEVFFLDAKNRLGAAARLSGKEADKPATVQLQRCGSVTVRIVDEQGTPVPKCDTWAGILLAPGIDFADEDLMDAAKKNLVLAELAWTANGRTHTDADGRITFNCLIPGATYRLGGQLPGRGISKLNAEFKVKPDQALDLGEIRVKMPKE